MRAILVFFLVLLAGNVFAENPVPLDTVSSSFVLDVRTLVAAVALIAIGIAMSMISLHIGISALRWLRQSAGDSAPKSTPAPAPVPKAQQGGSGPF